MINIFSAVSPETRLLAESGLVDCPWRREGNESLWRLEVVVLSVITPPTVMKTHLIKVSDTVSCQLCHWRNKQLTVTRSDWKYEHWRWSPPPPPPLSTPTLSLFYKLPRSGKTMPSLSRENTNILQLVGDYCYQERIL